MKTARDRVQGVGPRRHELKPFARLGTLPVPLLEQLRHLANTEKRSDLGGDRYTLPSAFDLKNTFNVQADKYRQVLFQTATAADPVSETEYAQWEPGFDELRSYLDSLFARVYRFRLSIMQPYHEIPWHIDTDTSVSCRAQICLNNGGSVFYFKTKTGVQELRMGVGDVYFINTGWPHSVRAGAGIRQVAIFGFQFDDAVEELQARMRACTPP